MLDATPMAAPECRTNSVLPRTARNSKFRISDSRFCIHDGAESLLILHPSSFILKKSGFPIDLPLDLGDFGIGEEGGIGGDGFAVLGCVQVAKDFEPEFRVIDGRSVGSIVCRRPGGPAFEILIGDGGLLSQVVEPDPEVFGRERLGPPA